MSRNADRPTPFQRWANEENSWDQKHDDREYMPLLHAPNAHEQAWRLPRLARVYATARHLFLIIEHRPLPATIVVLLQDDLGELTVTVSSAEWQDFLKPIFQLAWRSEDEKPESVRITVSANKLARHFTVTHQPHELEVTGCSTVSALTFRVSAAPAVRRWKKGGSQRLPSINMKEANMSNIDKTTADGTEYRDDGSKIATEDDPSGETETEKMKREQSKLPNGGLAPEYQDDEEERDIATPSPRTGA